MHYRIRGNNVQLVKPVAGEDGKKVKSQPIGSINLNSGELNAAAKAALSPAEIAEAKAWIANHKVGADKRNELELATLAERMSAVAVWLKGADEAAAKPYVDGLNEAMRSLRRALHRIQPAAGKAAGTD